jgi:hypothetical protein
VPRIWRDLLTECALLLTATRPDGRLRFRSSEASLGDGGHCIATKVQSIFLARALRLVVSIECGSRTCILTAGGLS